MAPQKVKDIDIYYNEYTGTNMPKYMVTIIARYIGTNMPQVKPPRKRVDGDH